MKKSHDQDTAVVVAKKSPAPWKTQGALLTYTVLAIIALFALIHIISIPETDTNTSVQVEQSTDS